MHVYSLQTTFESDIIAEDAKEAEELLRETLQGDIPGLQNVEIADISTLQVVKIKRYTHA